MSEKLQLMEDLWCELAEVVDACETPPEHNELLDERHRKVASGEMKVWEWDEVKRHLAQQ